MVIHAYGTHSYFSLRLTVAREITITIAYRGTLSNCKEVVSLTPSTIYLNAGNVAFLCSHPSAPGVRSTTKPDNFDLREWDNLHFLKLKIVYLLNMKRTSLDNDRDNSKS